MANRYSHTFVAACPNNGAMIIYSLVIETQDRMIQVEHIVTYFEAKPAGQGTSIANDVLFRLASALAPKVGA